MKLIDRVAWAKVNLKKVEPSYCILWEADVDGPLQITSPTPEWLAMALFGYLLPPAWVYRELAAGPDGNIANGHLLHDTPCVGPMTEEEAMEYLVEMVLPINIWLNPSNRNRFRIVPRAMVPEDRTFRDAWRLSDA